MRRIFFPLPIDPGPDLDKFAEIDFRIEIGREIPPMTASINVQNVDSIDLVEIALYRQGAIGIDHARIESRTQNRG